MHKYCPFLYRHIHYYYILQFHFCCLFLQRKENWIVFVFMLAKLNKILGSKSISSLFSSHSFKVGNSINNAVSTKILKPIYLLFYLVNKFRKKKMSNAEIMNSTGLFEAIISVSLWYSYQRYVFGQFFSAC